MEGTSNTVDEFYFSALHDHDQLLPISDERYAEELQLQEALMSSSLVQRNARSSSSSRRENSCSKTIEKSAIREAGQSSASFCDICMDTKPAGEMFINSGTCAHSFCKECISKYIAAKTQENIAMVKCPDVKCKGVIGPELCHSILPKEVLERWENALCESLILGSQKYYCPFKDCQAMLVDDGEEVVTVSECPNCRRLFCAQCKVVWHSGMDCREFRSLNKDVREREDIMFTELAKKKKWRRCPCCKFYVEKKEGCLHIVCRCGFEFCYGCGLSYRSAHKCPPT